MQTPPPQGGQLLGRRQGECLIDKRFVFVEIVIVVGRGSSLGQLAPVLARIQRVRGEKRTGVGSQVGLRRKRRESGVQGAIRAVPERTAEGRFIRVTWYI